VVFQPKWMPMGSQRSWVEEGGAKEDAEAGGIHDAEGGGAGVGGMQDAEERAHAHDAGPGSITTHQVLKGEATKGDFFARRAAKQKEWGEQGTADRSVRAGGALEVREAGQYRRDDGQQRSAIGPPRKPISGVTRMRVT
jgi:hypothetical protein